MTDKDMVNQPPHYVNQGEVECLDYIKQQLGDSYRYYLEGACIKYMHRYKYKGKELEDLEKHKFYLERLIREIKIIKIKALKNNQGM